MELKTCRGCGEAKESTREFYPVGSTQGKLRAKCKKCYNARKKREKEKAEKEFDSKKGQLCKICGERKPVSAFYPSHRYRKKAMCLPCSRARAKEKHVNTYEEKKKYYRAYYQKNKEYRRKWQDKYRKDNPDKLSEYRKRLHVKIKRNQSKRIKSALGGVGLRKSDRTVKYLGCTGRELVAHLESQFSPGMSWDNYGIKGWHIDHIRPCASFDFTDEKQLHDCFHYTNLQPLWAEDNMAKGASWDSSGAGSMLKFIDGKRG
jgi:hypothetical protein